MTYFIAIFLYFSVVFCGTFAGEDKPWPEILYAAREGDDLKVQQLLESGVDINIQEQAVKWSALYLAAARGHDDVVRTLIRLGADVDINEKSGWTPLMRVAFDGKESTAQILIDNKANLNIKSVDNYTALHLAVRYHGFGMVDLLARNGADMNIQSENGFTPVIRAAKINNGQKLECLIGRGANLNIQTDEGWSVLHYAAQNGLVKIVTLLLEKGLDINMRTNDGQTPLYIAAEKEKVDLVRFLLRNGADINIKNNLGWTSLFNAISLDHEQIVDMLIKNGSLLNIANNDGEKPMDIAVKRGHAKIINLLRNAEEAIAHRPAITACEEYGKLPTSHILGGELALSGEFPWMAALGYLKIPDMSITYDCGGTLISAFYILTADHCVRSRYPTVVRLGKLNLIDEDDSKATNYLIQDIKRHPNRSSRMKKNDIALIRVSQRVTFNTDISPACLETDLSDLNLSVELIVTGWGTVSAEKTIRSNELQKAQVKSMPLSECNATFLEFNKLADQPALRNGISESQYCAYDPQGRNDSCQGDSGGPLQYYPTPNSMPHVVGIVSFGVSCGSGLPGIYSRIAYYLDWIESIVWPKNNVLTIA